MEKKRQPLIIEFEAHHEGCPTIETSEKVKGSSDRVISISGADSHGVYHINEIRSPDINKFLEKISKHRGVKKLDVLLKGKDTAMVRLLTDKSMFVDSVGKTGCIVLPFTGTKHETDYYTLLVPSQKSFEKLNELLEGHYDFKLKSKHLMKPKEELALDTFNTSGFLKLAEANRILTQKQADAFELACKRGYYERPKKARLVELASEFGISKPAFAELLSKAESKLLPVFNEIVSMIR
ncbi:MAG: helix-turn-helix domain-containing protein [Candidatus Micrarchaeota archaeon]